MEPLNKTGKIKVGVLILFFLMNFFSSINKTVELNFIIAIVSSLLFGAFAIPLIIKINAAISGKKIQKPSWNDNPLNYNRPISFFHFGAFFLLFSGGGMMISSLIKFQIFSTFGVMSTSFGVGILLGIELALIWNKKGI